jgi:nitrite reductase (NADH) large subunit
MRLVIIGNGIAGLTFARLCSRFDTSISITIISKEEYYTYSRPLLPKLISKSISEEEIWLDSSEKSLNANIQTLLDCTVTKVDTANKKIEIICHGSPEFLSYDTLVFATGSSPSELAFPVRKTSGVFTIRTLKDVHRLQERLKMYKKSALVIGGGLLGIEIAENMMKAGVQKVHILEYATRLLPRQLDEKGSMVLQHHLESEGLIVKTGIHVTGIDNVQSIGVHPVSDQIQVHTETQPFMGQSVILAAGVTPNVSLAKDSGLKVQRGIVVDNTMATSVPDIYALGDCVEFENKTWGIIPAALEQCSIAASHICNKEKKYYKGTVPSTRLESGNLSILSKGKIDLSPEEVNSGKYREELELLQENNFLYHKKIMEGDTVIGEISIKEN